jgi:phage shock protein PspC (stress-responsive transcriptional regulator)
MMKKAVKINLGGVIFHIDEDAYEELKRYLNSVGLFFDRREGKEIIDDIETRIAELFQSRISTLDQVITINHVSEVIEIMGKPSDFAGEAEDSDLLTGRLENKQIRSGRRLYRDPEGSVLGGVCSGLGVYFGINPLWIRILFIILLIAGYGTWALVYIILWIAVPRAVTISQRLEMRGEPVTVSNIERSIKEEYEGVKSGFRNIEKTEGYRQTVSAVDEIFQVMGRIIVALVKVIAVLAGVVLVFSGLVMLIAFLGLIVFNFTPGWISGEIFPINHFLSAFIVPSNLTIILVALFFAIIIPLIAIIYGGIKLIFRLRTRDRGFGLIMLVIWILSISVLFTMSIMEGRKFAYRGSSQENVVIIPPPSNTLYLQYNEKISPTSLQEFTLLGRTPQGGIYNDPEREVYYSRPALSIRYAAVDLPELIIERKVRGPGPMQAEISAEKIVYNWEQNDSILIFDNFFSLDPGRLWNFAELNLRLTLPEDQQVHIGERMDRLITSARSTERVRIQSMTGRKWRMTKEGLKSQE